MILRILSIVFMAGVLVVGLIAVLILKRNIKTLRDHLDIQRIRIKKQDDAIRQKQNKIDQLKREIKRMERRRK